MQEASLLLTATRQITNLSKVQIPERRASLRDGFEKRTY